MANKKTAKMLALEEKFGKKSDQKKTTRTLDRENDRPTKKETPINYTKDTGKSSQQSTTAPKGYSKEERLFRESAKKSSAMSSKGTVRTLDRENTGSGRTLDREWERSHDDSYNTNKRARDTIKGAGEQWLGGHIASAGTTLQSAMVDAESLHRAKAEEDNPYYSLRSRGEAERTSNAYMDDLNRKEGIDLANVERAYDLNKYGGQYSEEYRKLWRLQHDAMRKGDSLIASGTEDLERAKEGAGKMTSLALDLGANALQMTGDMSLNLICPTLGMVSLMNRAGGTASYEARQLGFNPDQQFAYQQGTALIEGMSEGIFNSVSAFQKAYGKGAFSLAEKVGLKTASTQIVRNFFKTEAGRSLAIQLTRLGAEAFEEGFEEIVAGVAEPALKYVLMKANDPSVKLSDQYDLKEIGYDFLVGALMGGMGGSIDAFHGVKSDLDLAKSEAYGDGQAYAQQFIDRGLVQGRMREDGTRVGKTDAELIAESLQTQKSEGKNILPYQTRMLQNAISESSERNQRHLTNRVNEEGVKASKEDRLATSLGTRTEATNFSRSASVLETRNVERAKSVLGEDASEAGAYAVGMVTTGTATVEDIDTVLADPKLKKAVETITGITLPASTAKARNALENITAINQIANRNTVLKTAQEKQAKNIKASLGSMSEGGQDLFAKNTERAKDTIGSMAVYKDIFSRIYLDGTTKGATAEQTYERAIESLGDSKVKQLFTRDFVTQIFNEGRATVVADQAKQTAKTNADKYANRTSGVSFENNDTSLVSKKVAKALEKIAKGSKVEIRVVKTLNATDSEGKPMLDSNGRKLTANGMYKDGIIYISAESKNKLITVAKHELTHYIKDISPERYQELEDFVFERWYNSDSEAMQDAIMKYQRLYNGITAEEAKEEIIADSSEAFFTDQSAIEDAIAFSRKLGTTIHRGVKSILNSFASALKGDTRYERGYGEYLKDMGILEEAERMWAEALNESVGRGQNAETVSESELEAIEGKSLYSIKGDKARWTEDRIDRLIHDNGAKFEEDYSYAYATLMNPRDFLKLTVDDKYLGEWLKESQNVPEELKGMSYREKVNTVWNRKQETGKWLTPNENYPLDTEELKNNNETPYLSIDSIFNNEVDAHEGRHRMRALMEAGIESVPIVIRDTATRRYKAPKSSLVVSSQHFSNGKVNNGAEITLKDLVPINEKHRDELIKRFGGEADVKFSLTEDSDGNKLSKGQQEYFKDSKARDENGRLLKVYHGSTSSDEFTVFNSSTNSSVDTKKSGWNWFTPKEELASWYTHKGHFFEGHMKGGYINITNPLTVGEINRNAVTSNSKGLNFTKSFEKIANAVGVSPDELYRLVNEDYGGNENWDAVGDTYAEDVFATSVKIPIYAFTRSGAFRELVEAKGYDSIIAKEDGAVTYGVANSNQFKNADNQNPTENEDIRYSLSPSEKEAIEDLGATVTDGGSVAKFSVESWDETDVDQLRQKLIDANYPPELVDKWIRDVNSMSANIIRNRLTYKADRTHSALKNNSEYYYTLDLSTLCAKRKLYQGTFNAIMHSEGMENVSLLPKDVIHLRALMDTMDYEVPCGICYEESRKKNEPKFAKQWLFGYKTKTTEWAGYANMEHDDPYIPTLADVLTTDGRSMLQAQHPEVLEAYLNFQKGRGSANPKVSRLHTDYRSDILNMTKGDIENVIKIGGLRIQSFSDFELPHVLDMMQAVLDMSVMGLTSQAYTKVPAFAQIFGNTGIKINLSLIGKAVDGKLVFDDKEGIDHRKAFKLRKKFDKNVGTILVGANRESILLAWADPRIDMVIPFHRSGWSKAEFKALGLGGYEDFQAYQSERYILDEEQARTLTEKDKQNPKKKKPHTYKAGETVTLAMAKSNGFLESKDELYSNDYWDGNLSGKENAEKYLRLCAEQHRRPVFYEFLQDNGDGSWSLQPDGSTDGYWKSLIDFKMYDSTGKFAPQEVVKPTFNMQSANDIMQKFEGDPDNLPVADDVVKQFVKDYKGGRKYKLVDDKRIVDKNLPKIDTSKFSVSAEDDQTYLDAVNRGDMETAQRMVNKKASSINTIAKDSKGKPIHLYHGTNSFGFTVFKDTQHNVPFIYTSTDRTVSAHYAGDNHYASTRPIGTTYKTGNSTKDILENAKHVLGADLKVMSKADKKARYDQVREEALKVADRLDELESKYSSFNFYTNGNEKMMNAIAWVENQFWTIRDGDYQYNFDSNTEENAEWRKSLEEDVERFKDNIGTVREYYNENYKSLSEGEKALLSYLIGYDLGDVAIDIEYGMLRVATEDDLLSNKQGGNIISPSDLKENMDRIHNIGAYDMYGDLGDNPFEFDAKGSQFWAVEVPEMGEGYFSTDQICKWASENGYTSVIMHNIYDYGDKADNYVFFGSNQLKSADPVTYDDNGNVIPLSERFNPKNDDIRYSLTEDSESPKRDTSKMSDYQKAKQKIKDLRADRDQKIADLKQHHREVEQAKRERREESEDRTKLLNIARRLSKVKTNEPTQQLINEFIGELDLVAKSMTGKTLKKLGDLSTWYEEQVQADPYFYDSNIEKKLDRVTKKQISEINIEDVRELTTILKGIEASIRNGNKFVESQYKKTMREAGIEAIKDIDQSVGLKNKVIKKFDRFFINGTLSPLRQMHRVTGYNDNDPLYIATQELADGQRNMLSYEMNSWKMFQKYMDDKKFVNSLNGKKAREIILLGQIEGKSTAIKVTPDVAISLYLSSMNEDNLRHMGKGGVEIPDFEKYKKGDLKEAYNASTLVTFSKGQLDMIKSRLTEKEKAFAYTAYEYYNEVAPNAINKVSNILKGYDIARVNNYFPIQVNKDFLDRDFESLKFDGTIEGMGSLKERVVSNTPVVVNGIVDTLTRSIKENSMYVGLAIPVRNFGKLLGIKHMEYHTTEKGKAELGVEYTETTTIFKGSVQKSIRQKWGDPTMKYIEKFMGDLQMSRPKTDDWENALNSWRSNYAGAVLTLNLSVAIKQTASYPTAIAVLGTMPTLRALGKVGKVDLDLIGKYSPLQWYRSQGYSVKELGDIKAGKRGSFVDKVTSLPFFNWIQTMDVLTTRKLWKASEYYVRQHNKNLKRGTDEYYKAVAKIYDRVIEETQPNYTTMQRPQLLRSDSSVVQTLNMFKTQPFQNFNILYDAIGNYIAKAEAYKADKSAENKAKVRQANTDMNNALWSQFLQLATFASMTFVWAFLRGKDDKWKDEEQDKVTLESFLKRLGIEMLSGSSAMLPLGADIYSLATHNTTGDYYSGFQSITDSAINDLFNTGTDLVTLIGDFWENWNAEDKESIDTNAVWRQMEKVIKEWGRFAGVPAQNIKNLFDATYRWVMISANGKYVGEYEALKETVAKDTAKKAMLLKAYNFDKEQYKELRQRMIEDGFEEDKLDDYMWGKIKPSLLEAYNSDKAKYQELRQEMLDNGFSQEKIDNYMWDNRKEALFDAYRNDQQKYEELRNELLSEGYAEDKLDNFIDSQKKENKTEAEQNAYNESISTLESSSLWAEASEEDKDKYSKILEKMSVGIEDSQTESIKKKAVDGLTEEQVILYKLALKKADQPNANGNLGTYTKAEKEEALRLLAEQFDLTEEQKAVLKG